MAWYHRYYRLVSGDITLPPPLSTQYSTLSTQPSSLFRLDNALAQCQLCQKPAYEYGTESIQPLQWVHVTRPTIDYELLTWDGIRRRCSPAGNRD
jgi:hypothetical protein